MRGVQRRELGVLKGWDGKRRALKRVMALGKKEREEGWTKRKSEKALEGKSMEKNSEIRG